ncbi:MAG TPA: TadE/TadG family type IV pilus assembly protein [Stellaceae bacterium]|nr:TadE/TadG family type IV pilus assembly protein [Stellaceae bacterium]
MRIFRRFGRDERGTTLIEFALVGPMFIFLLLAIIEIGLTMLTQFVLDGAARSAARLVRTGQVQAGGGITTFQNQLCSQVEVLLPSCSGVLFEVQQFSNFASINFSPCTSNANATPPGNCPFVPGTGGQVVGVRVSYPRPYIVPWVGECLTTGKCWLGLGTSAPAASGTYTTNLLSTVVFQNEPFQ